MKTSTNRVCVNRFLKCLNTIYSKIFVEPCIFTSQNENKTFYGTRTEKYSPVPMTCENPKRFKTLLETSTLSRSDFEKLLRGRSPVFGGIATCHGSERFWCPAANGGERKERQLRNAILKSTRSCRTTLRIQEKKPKKKNIVKSARSSQIPTARGDFSRFKKRRSASTDLEGRKKKSHRFVVNIRAYTRKRTCVRVCPNCWRDFATTP